MLRKYLSQLISLLFLVFLVVYFVNNQDSFDDLLNVPIWILAVVAVTKAINIVINAIFTKETLRVFDKKISLPESVLVSFISALGNFFGPLLGGTSLRAYYLKTRLNFAYKHFTSTLLGYYVMLFFLGSVLGLIFLTGISSSQGETSVVLVLSFASLAVVLSLVILKNFRLSFKGKNKFAKKLIRLLNDVFDGWKSIKRLKGMPATLVLLSVVTYLTYFIATAAEFEAVGGEMSVANIGLYTVIFSFSILVALTPGALGIREAVLFAFSSLIGLSGEQILQIAVIDRSMNYLVLATGYLGVVIGSNFKVPLLQNFRKVLSEKPKPDQ